MGPLGVPASRPQILKRGRRSLGFLCIFAVKAILALGISLWNTKGYSHKEVFMRTSFDQNLTQSCGIATHRESFLLRSSPSPAGEELRKVQDHPYPVRSAAIALCPQPASSSWCCGGSEQASSRGLPSAVPFATGSMRSACASAHSAHRSNSSALTRKSPIRSRTPST